MKCQVLFSVKNKKIYEKMSSAAVVIGLFKVNRYMNYEMNRYNSKGDHSDLNVFCHTFQCGGDGGV